MGECILLHRYETVSLDISEIISMCSNCTVMRSLQVIKSESMLLTLGGSNSLDAE